VENKELSQLFAEAMEATDRRAGEAQRDRENPAEVEDATPANFEPEEFEPEDFELDMEVDATSADIKINFLPDGLTLASDDDDDDDEASDATNNSADSGPTVDTEAEINRLLASSFGGVVSDDDPDLSFPDFDDELDGGADMPADAASALSAASDNDNALEKAHEEASSLRRQFHQLSRTLADTELELQTAQRQIQVLEGQVVTTARQSAHTGREFDSFRKRAEREQEDTKKFATEKLLKELLGVLDNLERALAHAGANKDSPLGKGVEMTLKQFLGVLENADAQRIDPGEGDSFDQAFHEAVGQEPHETIPAGHIVRTLQTGLLLNERLVRAAMVVVCISDATKPITSAKAEPGAGTEQAPPAKKKKKKRRKKRKKSSEETAEMSAEGIEATVDGDTDAAPKKKRRKKKRKRKEQPSPAAKPEQAASESSGDN